MISGVRIKPGIRETSQVHASSSELCDFEQYFFGVSRRMVFLLQSSLTTNHPPAFPLKGAEWGWLDSAGTSRDNLIPAVVPPACPFHRYNLACLVLGMRPSSPPCWAAGTALLRLPGGFHILRWRWQLFGNEQRDLPVPAVFTGCTFCPTVWETRLGFFALSSSMVRKKKYPDP